MAMEIRSILFGQDEARAIIPAYLASRSGTSAGVDGVLPQLAGVTYAQGLMGVEARLAWRAAPARMLDTQALLAAVLLGCARSHLPLPRGGVKSLAFSGDTLILVIVTNRRTLEADCVADRRATALARALARGCFQPPVAQR